MEEENGERAITVPLAVGAKPDLEGGALSSIT
jgi:hypothetical protein